MITTAPATPDRWRDVRAIHANARGPGGWCQYNRLSSGDYAPLMRLELTA